VLLVTYVYTGFESGLVVAGEARNPQRDLPRALLAALFVCIALYVLIQAVSVAALPALASSTSPLVDVAAVLMGPWGALLLVAGVIASVGANLVGSTFSNPRITYRLTLDAESGPRRGSPACRFKPRRPRARRGPISATHTSHRGRYRSKPTARATGDED
jgi:amino acid transporter